MSQAPIDRLRFEPVPGKDGAFLAFDKETGEQFDAGGEIKRQFDAGKCRPEGWLEDGYKRVMEKHPKIMARLAEDD